MTIDNQPLQDFRIRVGHWRLRVRAHDSEEAIEVARRQLIQELPRLYDVIRGMEPARFELEDAA